MKVADSSSSHKIHLPITKNGGQAQVGQKELDLALGDMLKVRVLRVQADGTAILETNGRTLTAKSLVTLVPGEEMWLEVKEEGLAPLLSSAGKKGEAHDFIKTFFLTLTSREAPLARLFSEFPFLPQDLKVEENAVLGKLFLHLLSGVVNEKPDSDMVKLMAFIFGAVRQAQDKSGSNISSLFKDVLENIPPAKNQEYMPLQTTLDDAVKTVEMHQQLNARAPSPNESMFYLFPCFFAGDESWGEWFFSMNEGDDVEKGFSLDFFLEMSRLGPVSFHLQSHESGLRGEFRVSRPSARSHIEKELPELKNILGNLGYHSISLVCTDSDHTTPQEIRKKVVSLAGLQKFALIDIKA
jgi:hypothetical protein